MKPFSYQERKSYFENIDKTEYDLVIIGGGINGAGVARDAASRGLKVIVIEAQDFASGTSSRSSKLVHGGIRYLENLEFKLVFEALSERAKLFKIAPHLVHPLRFMIPLYKDSRVGMFMMGLGMWLYDALALFKAPKLHERLSAQRSFDRMPLLKKEALRGSYVYSDAYMDDDRLVHETLRSAHELGAHAINYVKAIDADFDDKGSIRAVRVQDKLSNVVKNVRGKHFISTVGPWTDLLAEDFFKTWEKVLRPTKGIHITVSKDRLPLSSAVVMAPDNSNRIVFGIPRHEMVIIGTTDTDFQDDPAKVSATPEDVKYLLKVVEQYFPGAKLTVTDIMATYAGVRPLVKDNAESEGKTSREHTIWSLNQKNITFVAGGKYTTYRLIAQQVVEHVLPFFDAEKRASLKEATTEDALVPDASSENFYRALDLAPKLAESFGRAADEVLLLAQRYGMEAEKIMQRCPRNHTYWQLEAEQAIDYTMCLNLVDFYSRRVPLFLSRGDHGLPFLEEISKVFQTKLSWSDDKLRLEKENLQNYMSHELAWQKQM